MSDPITATPSGQPPVNAGANAGANKPTRVGAADLETALMEASTAAANPPEASTPPAQGGPDPEPETPQPGTSGEIQTPETPPAEGEPQPAQGGDDQTALSQTGDAELDAALAPLTPAMRKHVATVSALLGDNALTPGEIPRIGQLLHERHELSQTIAQLTQERDELKTQVESGSRAGSAGATAGGSLPPEVVSLKSPGEVLARKNQLQNVIRSANNALIKHPNGNVANSDGEPKWKFGNQEFTREEIADEITNCQVVLDALPDRLQQLQAQQQLTEARKQYQQQTRSNYPWLTDPQNPRTKAVQQVLRDIPALAQTADPEYVAAIIVEGRKVLEAEKAARSNGHGNGRPAKAGTPNPLGVPALAGSGARPAGKVPVGKPHTMSGAALPTPGEAMKRFQATLPKPGERVTTAKLEDVLAALPPR